MDKFRKKTWIFLAIFKLVVTKEHLFFVLLFGVPNEQNASTLRLARYIANSQVSRFLFVLFFLNTFIVCKTAEVSQTNRKPLTWLIAMAKLQLKKHFFYYGKS